MAFVVEDGTGVTGANSLTTVAFASGYWADRGDVGWSGLATDAVREAALIQASEYLSISIKWVAEPQVIGQPLAWPRVDFVGVPEPVQKATARLAYSIAVRQLDLFATVEASDMVRRVKTGSVEIEFSDKALSLADNGAPSFPWLQNLLADYINTSSGGRNSAKAIRV